MLRMIVLLATLAAASNAVAQGLAEPGESWVQIASTHDLNTAIGIAGDYEDPSASVVLANNGWYAVVLGPIANTSIDDFRAKRSSHQQNLPADAGITSGTGYRRTVWQDQSPVLAMDTFYLDAPVTIAAGDLKVTAIVPSEDNKDLSMQITGAGPNGTLFDIEVGSADTPPHFPTVAIVRLHKATRYPQVVVTQYTGGAHCCTDTEIITEAPSGKWVSVPAGVIQWGFTFKDIDGDGAAEMLGVDEGFIDLYGYGPEIWTPTLTWALSGTKVTEISHAQRTRDFNRQNLAALQFVASNDPQLWHKNGFLAEWVATKALVGQLEDAWNKTALLYDRNDPVSEYCEQVSPSGHFCTVAFPTALAELLAEEGYGRPAGSIVR